jgi:type III pantothenate kinase
MEERAHLIIDRGNSRGKAALVRNGRLHTLKTFRGDPVSELQEFLKDVQPGLIGIGSVGAADKALSTYLQQLGPVKELKGDSPAPIKNMYATPATLGVDRLANAVGAWSLFPGRAVLVIDAGTCITYDFLTADGEFLGGAISPGMMMRGKAMHEHSARLPLVEMDGEVPLIGTDTIGSLRSGVHFGIVYEMAGLIEQFRHQYHGSAVILTGGDGLRFTRALKSGIFAHPYLTLAGLHALLVHDPDPLITGASGR